MVASCLATGIQLRRANDGTCCKAVTLTSRSYDRNILVSVFINHLTRGQHRNRYVAKSLKFQMRPRTAHAASF